MKAILVLEDGTVFEGTSFGAEGEAVGEIIFNTQVVGYQEIITDPAYRGQIIAMGYPHIGNYGINDNCYESDSAQASAMVVLENSKIYSNWQAKGSLSDFMKKHKVIGIEGIDTRTLTIHIRDHGEMRAVVSTKEFNVEKLLEKAKKYQLPDLVSDIKSQAPSSKQNKSKTVIINLGVNKSTLDNFPGAAIVPYDSKAGEVMELTPELVVLSGGPGDPRKLTGLINEIKKMIGKVPLRGFQNGACVLALALGCSVTRMKVGHHGVNHPVVDPKTGCGEISVQNHSYGIEKVPPNVQIVHVNLNDKTIEAFKTTDSKCEGSLYFLIDERGKLEKGYKRV